MKNHGQLIANRARGSRDLNTAFVSNEEFCVAEL